MKRTVSILLCAAMMALTPVVVNAQWYRGNPKQTIKLLEERTDTFKKSMDRDLDRSVINGTKLEDEINNYIKEFETATDHLRDQSEDSSVSPRLAREVLIRGKVIDTFIRRHPAGSDSTSDWGRVRAQLDILAWVYKLTWSW